MNPSPSLHVSLRALCLAVALSMGCGAGASKTGDGRSVNAEDRGPRLELGIRLSDGRWLELGDVRGRPVLLFVFATFDMVSQAAIKPLRPFVQQHPNVVVVGIASEPRATQLVEAWAYALDPPFAVGADPYGNLENGRTVLGRIEKVPTYILYDAAGYEVDRVVGYQSEAELEEMVSPVAPAKSVDP
ncbi:MAG: TlpA disulfide reductase family protein [Myxococcota bacterium]